MDTKKLDLWIYNGSKQNFDPGKVSLSKIRLACKFVKHIFFRKEKYVLVSYVHPTFKKKVTTMIPHSRWIVS